MVFKDRDYLIEENLDFIIHTTEQTCKRKISTENDDEFSIALIAFNKACDSYDKDKGDFNAYCKKVIKNALIDYFRKNCSNPTLYDENSFNVLDFKLSMDDYSKQKDSLSKTKNLKGENSEKAIIDIIESAANLNYLNSNNPVVKIHAEKNASINYNNINSVIKNKTAKPNSVHNDVPEIKPSSDSPSKNTTTTEVNNNTEKTSSDKNTTNKKNPDNKPSKNNNTGGKDNSHNNGTNKEDINDKDSDDIDSKDDDTDKDSDDEDEDHDDNHHTGKNKEKDTD